jgi:hypothetical protein
MSMRRHLNWNAMHRDMKRYRSPEQMLIREMLGDLRRLADHLAMWAEDHADEATSETWAALHCARETITKAERHTNV